MDHERIFGLFFREEIKSLGLLSFWRDHEMAMGQSLSGSLSGANRPTMVV